MLFTVLTSQIHTHTKIEVLTPLCFTSSSIYLSGKHLLQLSIFTIILGLNPFKKVLDLESD